MEQRLCMLQLREGTWKLFDFWSAVPTNKDQGMTDGSEGKTWSDACPISGSTQATLHPM